VPRWTNLTDEHLAFRDTVARFAAQHVAPVADALDRTDALPAETLAAFGDAGLIQLGVGTEHGGPGGDLTAHVIAREEVAAAGSMALAQLAGQNSTVARAVSDVGSAALRAELLPLLARGRTLTCIAVTEPAAGSDPSLLTTRATRERGGWVLAGEKAFISWASVADYALVFARSGDAPGAAGISAFLVDTADPGWVIERHNETMGERGVPNCDVRLDGVRVPADRLLGDEGAGFRCATEALQRNRPVVAAASVGCARAALDYAVHYGRERTQSGRPIVEFQGLSWLLAEMETQVEAARQLVYAAAAAFDAGAHHRERRRLASIAKLFAGEMAVRVSNDALQVLGGHGYLRDHPLERYVRDARLGTLYEGTSEIQRNIIAKGLIRS
jgi:alkylation response protein AidB-like acyl-CoA dehydrogenase